MVSKEGHGRAKYNLGCRCDHCKRAESEYQKGRRREFAESVGDTSQMQPPDLSLITSRVTCINEAGPRANIAAAVESAVSVEIEALGTHPRPGLVATALALARILDNPKAVSTQPSAAATLAKLLDTLHKSGVGGKPKLATVRRMTSSERT